MKNILKISLLVVAFIGLGLTAMNAQKFGYVKSQELLSTMPQVKSADAELEALQKQLQKKGQSMVQQLQQDYMAIQQKIEQGALSPKQQQEEGKKLEERQASIAKFEQDMVQQIQQKRDALLKPIYDKINKAIEDVGKEQGYTFIFDEGVLLYAQSGTDVTAQVKSKLGM